MTHTPGPWSADLKHQGKIVGTWICKNGNGCTVELKTLEILDDDTLGTIAIINCASCPPSKEDKANARLIAAAPELLGALVFCLSFLTANDDGEDDVVERIKAAKSAILKATGDKNEKR